MIQDYRLTDEEIMQIEASVQGEKPINGVLVIHIYDKQRAIANAQDAKTASIKDVECLKRVEEVLKTITEDFVEPVANFYMDDENRNRTFELWKQIKKQALYQALNKLRKGER